jgi:LacI family transcriptional regulator
MKPKFKITLFIETARKCDREILRGVARYSRLHGPWSISKTPPYYRTPSGRKNFINLTTIHSDGVIFMETESPEQILPTGLPAIAIDVRDQIYGLANIVGDCKKIGEIAAKHFLERGFKKFAFCGFDDIHWSHERCDSFIDYLQKAGYDVQLYNQKTPSYKSNMGWEKEKKQMIQWLKRLSFPVAIMACNDDRADNILEACKDCQIKVPDEIAVLGVDNDDMVCEITEPPLSSIEMNFEKAGFEAAHVLEKWMKGENMANETIIISPTRVFVRQSTDILAIDDREVANAISFINEHVREPIQVIDVANSVSVSRRMLEKRFKVAIGMSIGAKIRKVRADHIAKLLLETNMSISEIAHSMGFDSQANFSRYFQKEFQMKPLRYRKMQLRL